MALWIGKPKYFPRYEIGRDEKTFNKYAGWTVTDALIVIMDIYWFEKYTNIKLEPGEVRKIKSITIELEEL